MTHVTHTDGTSKEYKVHYRHHINRQRPPSSYKQQSRDSWEETGAVDIDLHNWSLDHGSPAIVTSLDNRLSLMATDNQRDQVTG